MEKLVTLVSGHQLYESVHKNKLQFLAKQVEKFGGIVSSMCKPAFNYDYGFIVSNLKEIPKELYEVFGRAGLKAKFESLLPNTAVLNLVY